MTTMTPAPIRMIAMSARTLGMLQYAHQKATTTTEGVGMFYDVVRRQAVVEVRFTQADWDANVDLVGISSIQMELANVES